MIFTWSSKSFWTNSENLFLHLLLFHILREFLLTNELLWKPFDPPFKFMLLNYCRFLDNVKSALLLLGTVERKLRRKFISESYPKFNSSGFKLFWIFKWDFSKQTNSFQEPFEPPSNLCFWIIVVFRIMRNRWSFSWEL